MRRILGYTYVGDTNYPINAVGTLLIATADSTPTTATPTFAVGTKAGINQGSGREYYVWVPPSIRTVSLADVGKLMVLKSDGYSTFNSGIFLITGFEALNLTVQSTSGNLVSPITITTTTNHGLTTGQTVTISSVTGNTNANGTWTATVTGLNTFTIPATGNGTGSSGSVITNTYIIDYRTMGVAPPQEAFDSMKWYLYAADSLAPVSGAVNSTWASGSYGGNGNSTTPRIIMQSPHPLGFQVRLCHETRGDYSVNGTNTGNVPVMTAIPGFGGNASGDFPIAGQHLHTALYYNTNAPGTTGAYLGATPGFGDAAGVDSGNVSAQHRITMVGDTDGYATALFMRRQFNVNSPLSCMCVFGLPENEPLPLPVNNAARLFCIGTGSSTNGGNNQNDISWSAGSVFPFNNQPGAVCQGISQSQGGLPIAAAPGLWTYTTGPIQGSFTGSGGAATPIWDGSGSDSPWTTGTEMLPVDVVVGQTISFSFSNSNTSPIQIFPLEPRVLGTIPHLRSGRVNFGDYSLTTEPAHSFQHMRRGVYITWNGPTVIP
jgi:hypothetical protein